MTALFDGPNTDDPEAKLERALMEEYLRVHRHTFDDLGSLPELERRLLFDAAAAYAARRLAEIGARAHYVEDLHRHE